jgi:hypothetical protein
MTENIHKETKFESNLNFGTVSAISLKNKKNCTLYVFCGKLFCFGGALWG